MIVLSGHESRELLHAPMVRGPVLCCSSARGCQTKSTAFMPTVQFQMSPRSEVMVEILVSCECELFHLSSFFSQNCWYRSVEISVLYLGVVRHSLGGPKMVAYKKPLWFTVCFLAKIFLGKWIQEFLTFELIFIELDYITFFVPKITK